MCSFLEASARFCTPRIYQNECLRPAHTPAGGAVYWLLRHEALAISALEYLAMEFFPPLFRIAYAGRKINIMKVMVAAWPFHYLPMGTLMKGSHMETLKVVLDTLGFLITQKVCPR